MAPVQGADQAIRPSCIAQGASGVRGRGWSSLAPEPGFVVGPSCRLIIGARTGLGCCDPVRWTARPAPGPPAPMFFASSLPRGFEIGPGTFATPVEVTTCIPIRAAACGDTPFALAPGTTPRDCTTLRLCPQRFELSSFVVLLLLAHHWARCCATWRVSVADTARTRAASIAQRRVGASQRSGSGRGCNGVRTRKEPDLIDLIFRQGWALKPGLKLGVQLASLLCTDAVRPCLAAISLHWSHPSARSRPGPTNTFPYPPVR